MPRIAMFCLLLGTCSSLEAADAARPPPASGRYLARIEWVQSDAAGSKRFEKELSGIKGTPLRSTIDGAAGHAMQIEIEDLAKRDAESSTPYVLKMVFTAPGKDGKTEVLEKPQVVIFPDQPGSLQIGECPPGQFIGSKIKMVIVEDAEPAGSSSKLANGPGANRAARNGSGRTHDFVKDDLAKKAAAILAAYVPSAVELPTAASLGTQLSDYHPTAESIAAARELDDSPAARALTAETAAIERRQADATRQADVATGKSLKERGTFPVKVKCGYFVDDTSIEADSQLTALVGEPLIALLGGTMDSEGKIDGPMSPPTAQCIEFDLREVPAAEPKAYRATFQVIAFDEQGRRSLASEAQVVVQPGKPHDFTIRKVGGKRFTIRLDIREHWPP